MIGEVHRLEDRAVRRTDILADNQINRRSAE